MKRFFSKLDKMEAVISSNSKLRYYDIAANLAGIFRMF